MVAVLCLTLAGCRRRVRVTENIVKQLQSGATQVDMRSSAAFIWDDMFVFGPYTPKGEMCSTLKLSESQCSKAGISDVDEYEYLMVFLHSSAVSRIESFPRKFGDFDDICLGKDITKAESVLAVERTPKIRLVCR